MELLLWVIKTSLARSCDKPRIRTGRALSQNHGILLRIQVGFSVRRVIMLRTRNAALLGLIACVVFWLALFLFGALRPSYSQSINQISELGAIGTPNGAAWNVVGFILPGLLLAAAGKAIGDSARSARPRSGRAASWLLLLFGLTAAGQGLFPASMVGGKVVVTSWHARIHLLMSLLSGIAWIAALLVLVVPMKRDPHWRGWHILNIVAVLLVIVGSFTLRGAVPDGLAQRVIDGVVYAWFIAMSLRLLRLGDRDAGAFAN